MVAKKRKSKRQTLQTKYKIVKRTKQHEKRVKKGLLQKFSNKKKHTDHIPNAWPYKEDLLMQIKAAKEKMEQIKQAKKLKLREERAKRKAELKRMQSGEIDEDDMEEDEDERQAVHLSLLAAPLLMKQRSPAAVVSPHVGHIARGGMRVCAACACRARRW